MSDLIALQLQRTLKVQTNAQQALKKRLHQFWERIR
jgi:hypothetical protein